MPFSLYVTADEVGKANHGAGAVTWNECEALTSISNDQRELIDRRTFNHLDWHPGPWNPDQYLAKHLKENPYPVWPKLSHFYAGCFSETVSELKRKGTICTYMAAAHDIQKSRKAHEDAGFAFNYPHLTDPELWKRYVAGYLLADVIICPSQHSKAVMQSYGCKNVVVIPHGYTPSSKPITERPKNFVCGYLGNCISPDKNLIGLLRAWKKYNSPNDILKIAGHDSTHPYVQNLVKIEGGGNIQLCGWIPDVTDFYDSLSLYLQCSWSEGFGLEVLEAMGRNRPVLCSTGTGASDLVGDWYKFDAADTDELAYKIQQESIRGYPKSEYQLLKAEAEQYEWPKIRAKYVDLWKTLI